MSKKVTSKEQLLSVAAASPLASAMALAMVLPGQAQALDFKVSSQQDLNNAVSALNAEDFSNSEQDTEHTITFSSSLAGKTLDMPGMHIRDDYFNEEGSSTTHVTIDGSAAPGMTLHVGGDWSNGYAEGIEIDEDVHLTVSNINLHVGFSEEDIPENVEGEGGFFGSFDGIEVDGDCCDNDELAGLTLDNVNVSVDASLADVTAVDTYYTKVSIQNSHFTGDTGSTTYDVYKYSYDYESSPVLLGKDENDGYEMYSVTRHHDSQALRARYSLNEEGEGFGLRISNSVFENFQYSEGVDIGGNYTYDEGGAALITNSQFNNQSFKGYALSVNQTDVIIAGSSFSGTQSEAEGALGIYGSDTVFITNSAVYNNKMENNFGGEGSTVRVWGVDQFVMFNSTIANNSGGSALDVDTYEDGLIMHSTVSQNNTTAQWNLQTLFETKYSGYPYPLVSKESPDFDYAESYAMPAVDANGDVEIINTIVSQNSGEDLYEAEGVYSSMIGSYIYDDEGGYSPIDDPMLGAVIGSGAGTTVSLKKASPAVDGADQDYLDQFIDTYGYIAESADVNINIDQTGGSRVFGDAPDMGALEWRKGSEGAAPKNPSSSSSNNLFGSLGSGMLASVFGLAWLRRRKK